LNRDAIRRLLRGVKNGGVTVDDAVERLRHLPLEDLGFATLDHHRALRRGYPEVVYGQGKTAEQIVEIVSRLERMGQTVLVTRVGADVHAAVQARHPAAVFHEVPRLLVVPVGRPRRLRPGILVLSAGTSDLPVAEEAAVTAEVLGHQVERAHDVGVAGLHRLLARKVALARARVIVAVAGMEGALPSVVAGLTDCPVIAVPTSTGYGAGAGGQAALLAMLNSCAGGIGVVNIDNGFGAGLLAAMINRQSVSRPITRS
jgi:NCAIR mutase (PurE)-related protein